MTDLDRKIAELKGWEWDEAARMVWTEPAFEREVFGEKVPARRGLVMSYCSWSTSDSRALELVDELGAAKRVLVLRLELMAPLADEKREWMCTVTLDGGKYKNTTFAPIAPTRPEAICRAYIAAREWMEKRGKGGGHG